MDRNAIPRRDLAHRAERRLVIERRDRDRAAARAGGRGHRSDFMTARDRAEGALVEVLAEANVRMLQSIHAVYYRNTALAPRTACFLDCLSEQEWAR